VAALSIPLIAIRFGWRSALCFQGDWICLAADVVAGLPSAGPSSEGDAGGDFVYSRRQDVPSASPERGPRRWLKLARDRNVWGIVLGRALTDPICGSTSPGCLST